MPEIVPRIRPTTSTWAPTQVPLADVADARALLAGVGSAAVLTGAGVSTDSGVPDYRGPGAPASTPMLYQEFLADEENRRRYWARSFVGYARMRRADPNPGHRALAAWERTGVPCRLTGLITQNVDGLHERAGQRRLVTLHGRIEDVICLSCRRITPRARVQERLAALNPGTDFSPVGDKHPEMRPDGDAVVDRWDGFRIAACEHCGGTLKPDVVFFGESAPPERVEAARAMVDAAEALVVVGSSLTVMSGLRFPRQAHRDGKPVVIINHGRTRGDELAALRLDAGTSAVLTALVGAAEGA